jgi:hypothetical protein
LSNWDPDGDNVPALKLYQVKVDCTGYMSGKGAPLDVAFVPCTNDRAGNALCAAAFGESWTRCYGGTCKAAYLDKSGTKRAADNWCAELSAGSGESCDSADVVSEDPCYQDNFFALYSGIRVDRHIVYYGGTLVLDIPPGAKGKYCVELRHDETFLADTSAPPIDIPTAQENGFCVNIVTGQCCFGLGTPDAGCVDNVLRSECEDEPGPVVFTPDESCPPDGPDCGRFLGACCDTLSGQCVDDTFEGHCQGDHRVWTRASTCADAGCVPERGACCNHALFGGCTDDVALSDCWCATCTWHKLQACAEIECAQSSIPTISEWGLGIMTLLLLTAAKIYFGRSKPTRRSIGSLA